MPDSSFGANGTEAVFIMHECPSQRTNERIWASRLTDFIFALVTLSLASLPESVEVQRAWTVGAWSQFMCEQIRCDVSAVTSSDMFAAGDST